MVAAMSDSGAGAIHELQTRYALALDGRDRDALLSVFAPGGEFAMYPPGAQAPAGVVAGHEQLQFITEALATRYRRTMHVLSNHWCTIDGDTATGGVYCCAHHLLADGSPTLYVVMLNYLDTYERDVAGTWRIRRREAHFEWIEERPTLEWADGARRARMG
jgi:hypothetical protein